MSNNLVASYANSINVSAILKTSTETSFTNKLEKHLLDHKYGLDALSSDVVIELQSRKNASSDLFAHTDPKLNSSYLGFQTALSYDAKARFIRGVSSVDAVIEFSQQKNLTASDLTPKELEHQSLINLLA